MNVEKKREFIINVIYFLIIAAIIYITIKYALGWFLPFVLGFGIAFMLKPLINVVTKKLKINRKLVAGLTVLIFYATVGALFTLIIVKIFIALKEVFIQLPNVYRNSIEPVIFNISNNVDIWIIKLDPSLYQTIREMISSIAESLGTIISSISAGVVTFLSAAVSMVPSFFIMLIFTIISSFFFAMDYVKVTGFITKQFSPKMRSIFFEVKDYIVGTLFKFVKAYSIIMGITFLELAIGLSILRVENSITIALLIACVDILPVLGTGGIVIPWILIEIFKGNIPFAIGLSIVYIVITVIRNILEPKIVGKQVGLHPIIMLICIFIGARLFGFIGIFVLPIIVIILKNLNDSGKIKIIK
ncbi:MAG: sporulation integral membrane protein YtvI [Clostridium sp.]|uniref:sporulation integral membrane protein YtvI n=1 Tax=Clostridium sp. TaxID=1506 RepID=UPI0025BB4E7A|nr:sporulation integral membrane protein YtvI [Clostridium sp.]MCF0148299.1 sporulation integral membrane protein YtvI [Clostridium sp.]